MRSGTIQSTDGEGSWTQYVVFGREDLPEELRPLVGRKTRSLSDDEAYELNSWFYEEYHWRYSYRGPGRPFSETPLFYISKSRIMFKQSGGWDI